MNQISLDTGPKSEEKILIRDLCMPDHEIINQMIFKQNFPLGVALYISEI